MFLNCFLTALQCCCPCSVLPQWSFNADLGLRRLPVSYGKCCLSNCGQKIEPGGKVYLPQGRFGKRSCVECCISLLCSSKIKNPTKRSDLVSGLADPVRCTKLRWLSRYIHGKINIYTCISCFHSVLTVHRNWWVKEPVQGKLYLPVEWANILYENLECSKILAFGAGSWCLACFTGRSEKQSLGQDQNDWDMGWEKIWLLCSRFMVKSALSVIVVKCDLCSMPFLLLLFCKWKKKNPTWHISAF